MLGAIVRYACVAPPEYARTISDQLGSKCLAIRHSDPMTSAFVFVADEEVTGSIPASTTIETPGQSPDSRQAAGLFSYPCVGRALNLSDHAARTASCASGARCA